MFQSILRCCRASALVLLSLTTFSTITRAEVPAKLLRWVPADANAVAVVDVKALFQTPLGTRENWRKQAADKFVNQEISVPPEAIRLVTASLLDLGGGLQPLWELGIVELERTPSFALIARREAGHLDTIATRNALKLPTGRTVVELDQGVVLGTAQPSRQLISRWLTSASQAPRLSPYLAQAVQNMDSKSHALMAVELTDSVTAPPIRTLLEKFEPLKGKTADQADIADVLASVQGVAVAVRVADKREGSVRIDFEKPAALLKPVAKPLVEFLLQSLEISLVDIDSWTASVSGKTLILQGEFSQGDLRSVMSLFAVSPASRDVHELEAETPAVNPQAAKAEVTRKYFHSVRSLVDELRKTLGKTRDNHNVYFERYARKIDDLPLKDVDKDMLVFGGNVSSSLRYQAQAGRMAAVRAGVREAQPVYQSYSYGAGAVGPFGSWGGYSFSGTVRALPEYGQIRTEERASASQVRISEMKQIDDGAAQIRKVMTERYGIEF